MGNHAVAQETYQEAIAISTKLVQDDPENVVSCTAIRHRVVLSPPSASRSRGTRQREPLQPRNEVSDWL
jgi:hypothetical protein